MALINFKVALASTLIPLSAATLPRASAHETNHDPISTPLAAVHINRHNLAKVFGPRRIRSTTDFTLRLLPAFSVVLLYYGSKKADKRVEPAYTGHRLQIAKDIIGDKYLIIEDRKNSFYIDSASAQKIEISNRKKFSLSIMQRFAELHRSPSFVALGVGAFLSVAPGCLIFSFAHHAATLGIIGIMVSVSGSHSKRLAKHVSSIGLKKAKAYFTHDEHCSYVGEAASNWAVIALGTTLFSSAYSICLKSDRPSEETGFLLILAGIAYALPSLLCASTSGSADFSPYATIQFPREPSPPEQTVAWGGCAPSSNTRGGGFSSSS